MKKLIALISITIILLACTAMAKTSKVVVKRIGENLYKTNTGTYIETSDCPEEVAANNAVLKYEKKSKNNKITFENGKSCSVVIVFK